MPTDAKDETIPPDPSSLPPRWARALHSAAPGTHAFTLIGSALARGEEGNIPTDPEARRAFEEAFQEAWAALQWLRQVLASPSVGPGERCGRCRACLDGAVDEWGDSVLATRMIVCSLCGNKRCPHATDHRYACTNSNEPGQLGSVYAATPMERSFSFDTEGLEARLREYAQLLERFGRGKSWMPTAEDLAAAAERLDSLKAERDALRAEIQHAHRTLDAAGTEEMRDGDPIRLSDRIASHNAAKSDFAAHRIAQLEDALRPLAAARIRQETAEHLHGEIIAFTGDGPLADFVFDLLTRDAENARLTLSEHAANDDARES